MARILNYSSIVRNEGEKVFFKEFFEEVFQNLKKFYGEEEAKKVLKALKKKEVVIRNIETFCTPKKVPFEPSNQCYLESLDLLSFMQKVILACREVENTGASYITLTSFFIQAYGIIRGSRLQEHEVSFALKAFLTGVCGGKGKTPYVFRIPDIPLAAKIAEAFKVEFKAMSYCRFITSFLNACDEVVVNKVGVKIELLHVLVEDYMDNIAAYLADTFKVTKTKVKEELAGIRDFTGPQNSKIITKLDLLSKEFLVMDFEPILLTLKHIQRNCRLRTFGDEDLLTYVLRKGGASLSLLKNPEINISHSFISELELEKEFTTPYCEIEVDCSSYNIFEEASIAANYAVKLAILKYRRYVDSLPKDFAVGATVKVLFTNIQNLSTKFVREAEKFRKNMESKYMRNVTFSYYYDPSDSLTRFGFGEPKYIRVISDIHADHPKNSYYSFNFGSDYVINCGDIANDCVTAVNWTKANMVRGLVVPGNHMGYDYPFPELNIGSIAPENTRTEQLRYCSLKFPAQVELLNNSVKEYNGITFLCTTLHSNLSLYGEQHWEECMGRDAACINDYRRIFKTTGNYSSSKVEPFTPQDTLAGFENSIKFLERELKKAEGKCVVVVSHFAPLPYSIDRKYAHDPLNPYFVNDLSWLFEKYGDRLRLWCHGHIHSCVDYLYNGVRVIACPFGYGNENGFETPYKYGTRISVADIKSTKPWKDIVKKLKEVGD